MRITGLNLQDFRNIASASLEFKDTNEFILGANAQGKSNLLEALSLVTALRSFRTRDIGDMVRFGTGAARLRYLIDHEKEGTSEVFCELMPSRKEISLDGQKVKRLGDFLGKFPSVVFSSQDIQFLRGSPSLRRRFMDLSLSAMDAEYYAALRDYHRSLKERNALLKQKPSPGAAELSSFEKMLAPAAAVMVKKRQQLTAALCDEMGAAYREISGSLEQPSLRYKPSTNYRSEDEFLAMLEKNRPRDLVYGSTQSGPHRDDFVLVLGDREAQPFSSEGQQRSLVLALKLAQVDWFRKHSGLKPVILADDILGELDNARREGFWRALPRDLQVFATGTAPPPDDPIQSWSFLGVEKGVFFNLPEIKSS